MNVRSKRTFNLSHGAATMHGLIRLSFTTSLAQRHRSVFSSKSPAWGRCSCQAPPSSPNSVALLSRPASHGGTSRLCRHPTALIVLRAQSSTTPSIIVSRPLSFLASSTSLYLPNNGSPNHSNGYELCCLPIIAQEFTCIIQVCQRS